jgi:hypothetical protein
MFWACLSIAFLGGGSLAAGFLFTEETDTKAVLLFVAALLGGVGCIFSAGCFLQQLSSKPKGPYI